MGTFYRFSLLWLEPLGFRFFNTYYKFHPDGNLAKLLGLEFLIDAMFIEMREI